MPKNNPHTHDAVIFLVHEYPDLDIDEDFLEELADEEPMDKDFFSSSLTFYRQVKYRKHHTLSEKQKNWLWEITCILADRKNNRND